MARVLIVYESKYGQTDKISKFLSDQIKSQGHSVDLADDRIMGGVNAQNYDGIIVGAPIYIQSYPKKIQKWVESNAVTLNSKPSAFFSVCLGIMQKDEKTQRDLLQISEKFFSKSAWSPKRRKVFAGALTYSKYNWFIKQVMWFIARSAGQDTDTKKDYEFTNWEEVRQFGSDFIKSLKPQKESRAETSKHPQ